METTELEPMKASVRILDCFPQSSPQPRVFHTMDSFHHVPSLELEVLYPPNTEVLQDIRESLLYLITIFLSK
jgi:hypothetical protein